MAARACDGCGKSVEEAELSALRDRRLCRACFPRKVSLRDLMATKEQSPYMAFALSVLLPGAGHAYAGAVRTAYAINFILYAGLGAVFVLSSEASTRAFIASLMAAIVLIPLVALVLGRDAYRLSARARAAAPGTATSLRPLWIFVAVAIATLLAVGVVLVGCVARVFMGGGLA